MILLGAAFAVGKKTWVARIHGLSSTYGFNREFMSCLQGKHKGAGRAEYALAEEGLYEICELDERRFLLLQLVLEEELITPLTQTQALAFVEALEKEARKQKRKEQAEKRKERKAIENEIDLRIAKINGEGGFTLL